MRNKKEPFRISSTTAIGLAISIAFTIFIYVHFVASNFGNIRTDISKTKLIRYNNDLQIQQTHKIVENKNSLKRIAFAITITKDGNFLDGAAVLAYSLIKIFQKEPFEYSLIAFVHPTVSKSRPLLEKLGFHVIEATTPINVSAITHDWLRQKINKNGCCGASELIKLNSYRLTQYHRVLHMDADTILINVSIVFTLFFDFILIFVILKPISELLDRNYSLVYTTDPNMATHKGERHMPVQVTITSHPIFFSHNLIYYHYREVSLY